MKSNFKKIVIFCMMQVNIFSTFTYPTFSPIVIFSIRTSRFFFNFHPIIRFKKIIISEIYLFKYIISYSVRLTDIFVIHNFIYFSKKIKERKWSKKEKEKSPPRKNINDKWY